MMPERYQPAVRFQGQVPGAAWIMAFAGSQVLVHAADPARFPTFYDVAALIPESAELHHLGSWDGHPVFAVAIAKSLAAGDDWQWLDLRRLLGVLDESLFHVAGRAAQILDWARNHRFCGRCGSPTGPHDRGERALVCPSCGFGAYPRINPCVIAIVTRGDEILLARAHRFANGMFSALAGFMEVGESAEQTLVREVREEVGVDIGAVRYFASQSWPFPSNLMLAYLAEYAGGEIRLQEDEIAEAGFFHYTDLPLLPPPGSIARAMIDHFVAERRAHHA